MHCRRAQDDHRLLLLQAQETGSGQQCSQISEAQSSLSPIYNRTVQNSIPRGSMSSAMHVFPAIRSDKVFSKRGETCCMNLRLSDHYSARLLSCMPLQGLANHCLINFGIKSACALCKPTEQRVLRCFAHVCKFLMRCIRHLTNLNDCLEQSATQVLLVHLTDACRLTG